MTRSFRTRIGFLAVLALVVGAAPLAQAAATAGLYGLPKISRADFNRLAVQQGLPLFWLGDPDEDGVPAPGEVAFIGLGVSAAPLVRGGAFTRAFETAYRAVAEALRQETVRRELDQARPTLVVTDLSGLRPAEKTFVAFLLKAAAEIDRLYLKQVGAWDLLPGRVGDLSRRLEGLDPASRTLFQRNLGPWCVAPLTEQDPFCNGLPALPPRRWDTYPADVPHEDAFCEELRTHADAKQLLDPFQVVRRRGGGYVAVPYGEAYRGGMRNVARALRGAAKALRGRTDEAALVRYLLAAAEGFETNQWNEADEAWAAMNAENSAWYLRIAPDEVYWDLCQSKGAFHLSFARIDRRSLEWQAKLDPLRDDMEQAFSDLIGEAYGARDVSFHMPDFIEIILNAGDSKSPMGATIGQSLPNWGPVAEEGRGRTVVMTNLYQDPDSRRVMRSKAASLLTPASMSFYSDDPTPEIVGIILHEAAHNLGPHSDFRIGGKGPREIFGGRVASLLEELKAQTASLYLLPLLREHGALTAEEVRQSYTGAITWAFGHVSRGMFTPTGIPKTYSQLAAVQVGFFMEAGALRWEVSPDPDRGEPVGRFAIDFEKLPDAVRELMRRVGTIKSTGDTEGAEALITPYVEGDKRPLVHMDEIRERSLAYPKATFLYSVTL